MIGGGRLEASADWYKCLYVAYPTRKCSEGESGARAKMDVPTPSDDCGPAQDSRSEFCFSTSPNMEDIRRLQAQFTVERDWNQFHQPRNLLLALVGEVGELAEIFQWKGEVSEGLPGWSQSERQELSHELSDVLIYLLELAEKCHVDLPRAVLDKMELNVKKYPAGRVQGSSKKYTEYACEGGACSTLHQQGRG